MTAETETPYYCAQASLKAGEMCFGTAVNADIWLLIEFPLPWGLNAVKESSLPLSVKDHLAGLTRTSRRIRVQFIKQASRTDWPMQVFVAFTRQTKPYMVSLQIDSFEQLLELNADDLLNGKVELEHSAVDEPIYLVCTHGVHDKCCAKFGFATYKLMKDITPGNVWQTSHVGGDRFASNVISFPTGVYYGHVDDESARTIIEAENNHEIYLERYRGRTCFGAHGQVAEYFVRRESGIRKTDGLKRKKVWSDEKKIEWAGLFVSSDQQTRYLVEFRQVRSDFAARLTCHANEEKSPFEYHLLRYEESSNHDGD